VLAAASVHAQTPYNWGGFYAGVNAGGGLENDSGNAFCINPAGILNGTGCDTQTASRQHLNPGGPFAGFQGGYNWQFATSPVVLGIEADFQGSAIDDSVNGATANAGEFWATQQMHWFSTLRPRIGWTGWNPFMLYATGGLMVGSVHVTQDTVYTLGAYPSSKTSTKLGWIAGVGGEAMITPALSLKIEGGYFNIGSITTQAFGINGQAGSGFQGGKKFTNEGGLIRIGVNYHFGAPPPPPPVAAPPAPPPAAVAPSKQMFIVFFEFDKSLLTPDGRKVVDAAATAFKAGKSSVAIAGYTDLAGTAQYNMALSKRRADTVKGALVRDGVPAAAIDESWHGKENPRVPTADGVREPQNRRVEITM